MAQRVSRGPLQIAEVDIHLINEVFRQIQLEIDNIRGLSGGNVQIGEHTHTTTGTDPDSPPFGGAISHDDLDDVSINDHHNKSHAHDGADGSGQVSFEDLTDVPTTFERLDEAQHTEKMFDRVIAGTNITITELADGDAISIEATAGSGETNTASNLGGGEGVFAQKNGVDLEFKSLTAGSNITLTASATEIEIASSGSGSSETDQALTEASIGAQPRDWLMLHEDTMSLGELAQGEAVLLRALQPIVMGDELVHELFFLTDGNGNMIVA